MVHGIVGQFDREAFGGMLSAPPTMTINEGQDTYSAATLTIPISDWKITGAYVHSGLGQQRVWSAGLEGKVFGRAIFGEYAQAVKDFDGVDIKDYSDDRNAWIAGLNVIDTSSLTLTGKYGQLDRNYGDGAFLSSLNPYAAISPHDIDWVDRPLFLDANNIARGWEVCLAYRGLMQGTLPINVRYYDGDRFSSLPGDDYSSGDRVITVSVSKEIAQDVTATLLWGMRDVKKENEALGFPAGLDPDAVQVVRGELAVAF
jgi:hypothetical protein